MKGNCTKEWDKYVANQMVTINSAFSKLPFQINDVLFLRYNQ